MRVPCKRARGQQQSCTWRVTAVSVCVRGTTGVPFFLLGGIFVKIIKNRCPNRCPLIGFLVGFIF